MHFGISVLVLEAIWHEASRHLFSVHLPAGRQVIWT